MKPSIESSRTSGSTRATRSTPTSTSATAAISCGLSFAPWPRPFRQGSSRPSGDPRRAAVPGAAESALSRIRQPGNLARDPGRIGRVHRHPVGAAGHRALDPPGRGGRRQLRGPAHLRPGARLRHRPAPRPPAGPLRTGLADADPRGGVRQPTRARRRFRRARGSGRRSGSERRPLRGRQPGSGRRRARRGPGSRRRRVPLAARRRTGHRPPGRADDAEL